VAKLEAKSRRSKRISSRRSCKQPSPVLSSAVQSAGRSKVIFCWRSSERLVHDRSGITIKKYLPSAQEVTERDVWPTGAKPGTPKFQKTREE